MLRAISATVVLVILAALAGCGGADDSQTTAKKTLNLDIGGTPNAILLRPVSAKSCTVTPGQVVVRNESDVIVGSSDLSTMEVTTSPVSNYEDPNDNRVTISLAGCRGHLDIAVTTSKFYTLSFPEGPALTVEDTASDPQTVPIG